MIERGLRNPRSGAPASNDKEVWDWLQGQPVIPVYTDLITVSRVVVAGPGVLMGVSYQNGAADDWSLIDGLDGTGPTIARLILGATGKDQFDLGGFGVFFARGIFAQANSGGIRLTVWVRI